MYIISPPSVASMVQAGWADYGTGKYASALGHFESAISQDAACFDGYNGLGWSSFKLGDFSEAIDYFRFLLPLREAKPALAADGYAGLAALYMTQNEDELAIDAAWEVLSIAGEAYTFTHDSSITSEDIHVLLARCYYNNGNFYKSQLQVNAVDPNFPEPSLISSKTVVDTVAAAIDSLHMRIYLTTTFPNIILVSSVTDSLGQIDYEVVDVPGEENRIEVTGESLPSAGRHFIVEYTYVEDYFEYLIVLAQKIESLAAF
ncbi:MAG: tetratricopeptide repeat protein [bacterium]